MIEPAQKHFGEGKTRLCYFEWGEPAGQVILLLHATGFHARCWDKVVAALPSDYRIIAVDLPGHGRSAKPESLSDWRATAASLINLVEQLDLTTIIGVGHSMGGHCLVQMASQIAARFERLLLLDPVIMDPTYYAKSPRLEDIDPSSHSVARRRNNWDSPEQMFDRLKDHPSYAIWHPEILMDYCRFGLLPAPEGDGFELACPPVLEASVYLGSVCSDPYSMVSNVTAPVTILRAPSGPMDGSINFTHSPTWPGLVNRFSNAKEVFVSDLTHFMPMQDPDRIAGYVLDAS